LEINPFSSMAVPIHFCRVLRAIKVDQKSSKGIGTERPVTKKISVPTKLNGFFPTKMVS